MKKLKLVDIKAMNNTELVDALVANAEDMGIAKVYLEADNYNNDEYNVDLLITELERRLYEWFCIKHNAHGW